MSKQSAESKAKKKATVQNMVYIVPMKGNKILLQKKGRYYQIIASRINPAEDAKTKALEVLNTKTGIVVQELSQISSKAYTDTTIPDNEVQHEAVSNATAENQKEQLEKFPSQQRCQVFLAVIGQAPEEKKDNFIFCDISQIDSVEIKIREISKKIINENRASILRHVKEEKKEF